MIQVLCLNIAQLSEADALHLYRCAEQQRQEKARRFHSRKDAQRCIAAGALLQYAYFTRTGSPMPELSLAPLGKPFFSSAPDFHFNLSHSGDWVAVAFGDEEVGLDIAQVPREQKQLAVARRFFTEAEREYVFCQNADPHLRFFEVWTAKESYLKYLGAGLSRGLSTFCVRSPQDLGVAIHTEFPEAELCLSVCACSGRWNLQKLTARELMACGCF